MKAKRKLALVFVAVVTLAGSAYGLNSFVFYAWLNAADPERWPAERAAIWAYGSLGIAVILFGVFLWSVVAILRGKSQSSS